MEENFDTHIMTKEFEELVGLVKSQVITIGVNRNHVNNFWCNTSKIGKTCNLFTYLLIVATILVFIKAGFMWGVISIFITGAYSVAITKLAGLHVRLRFLKEEKLFEAAYGAKSATLRDNNDGKIIYFPTDWRKWISEIKNRNSNQSIQRT
jgi:uncharacterized transporter YbjL